MHGSYTSRACSGLVKSCVVRKIDAWRPWVVAEYNLRWNRLRQLITKPASCIGMGSIQPILTQIITERRTYNLLLPGNSSIYELQNTIELFMEGAFVAIQQKAEARIVRAVKRVSLLLLGSQPSSSPIYAFLANFPLPNSQTSRYNIGSVQSGCRKCGGHLSCSCYHQQGVM